MMQQTKNGIGTAAEFKLLFSSQEEEEDCPGTLSYGGSWGGDAEVPSVEALIQAVLRGDTGDADACGGIGPQEGGRRE